MAGQQQEPKRATQAQRQEDARLQGKAPFGGKQRSSPPPAFLARLQQQPQQHTHTRLPASDCSPSSLFIQRLIQHLPFNLRP